MRARQQLSTRCAHDGCEASAARASSGTALLSWHHGSRQLATAGRTPCLVPSGRRPPHMHPLPSMVLARPYLCLLRQAASRFRMDLGSGRALALQIPQAHAGVTVHYQEAEGIFLAEDLP